MIVRIASAALSLSLAAAASGQSNLLANPGFDGSLDGWSNPFERPAAWDSDDLLAAPDSGSARLGHDEASNGGYVIVLSQCVSISVPGHYRYGAWMRNPPGQPAAGSAIVFVQQHFNDSCSALASSQNTGIVSGSTWELREAFVDVIADVQSLQLSLAVGKPAGVTELHEALFDEVLLMPYDPIFADGFEPVP